MGRSYLIPETLSRTAKVVAALWLYDKPQSLVILVGMMVLPNCERFALAMSPIRALSSLAVRGYIQRQISEVVPLELLLEDVLRTCISNLRLFLPPPAFYQKLGFAVWDSFITCLQPVNESAQRRPKEFRNNLVEELYFKILFFCLGSGFPSEDSSTRIDKRQLALPQELDSSPSKVKLDIFYDLARSDSIVQPTPSAIRYCDIDAIS